MKNTKFRRFIASLGVATMMLSTVTNAVSPVTIYAEEPEEFAGEPVQEEASAEEPAQEEPQQEPMAISEEVEEAPAENPGEGGGSDENFEESSSEDGGSSEDNSAESSPEETSAEESGENNSAESNSSGNENSGNAVTEDDSAQNASTESTDKAAASTDASTAVTTEASTAVTTEASTAETTESTEQEQAKEQDEERYVITEVLTGDMSFEYTTENAPSYDALMSDLGDRVRVVVNGNEEEIPVDWDGSYDGSAAGSYTLYSQFDQDWDQKDRYDLADGVELPKASVNVTAVQKEEPVKEEPKKDDTPAASTEKKDDAAAEATTEKKDDASAEATTEKKEDKKDDASAESTTEKKEDQKDNASTESSKKEDKKDDSSNKKEESSAESSEKSEESEEDASKENDDSDESAAEETTEKSDDAATDATTDKTSEEDIKKDEVNKAATLRAAYIDEDGATLDGTITIIGDSFTAADKAKAIDGYTLVSVTLDDAEIDASTAFEKQTNTTETDTEIITEISYIYGDNVIEAGSTATLTYTYHQDAQPVAVALTTKVVDENGDVIEGAKVTYSVGENDAAASAPVITGYEFVKATLNGAEIKTVKKSALDGQYEYYVDGEQLTADSEIVYEYQKAVEEVATTTDAITSSAAGATVTVTPSAEAMIPEGTEVKVESIAADRVSAILARVGDSYNTGVFYDITLEKDGETVKPAGPVKVELQIGEAELMSLSPAARFAKVHVGENVEVSDVAEDEFDSMLFSFETDHFSPFGVAAQKDEATLDDNYVYSSDFANFVTSATIEGVSKNSEGKYELKANTEYAFNITFAEKDATGGLQFDTDAASMTYTLPDGFEAITTSGTSEVQNKTTGTTFTNNWTISNGVLTYTWDKSGQGWTDFCKAANGTIQLKLWGKVSASAEIISWSTTVPMTVVVDTKNSLKVKKDAEISSDKKTVKYTVTVESKGKSENVEITDAISGDILKYNEDADISSNKELAAHTAISDVTSKGFKYTIPSMVDGEIVTIKYTATIDTSKLGVDGTLTEENSANTVTYKSDGDHGTVSKNLANKISYTPSLTKSGAVQSDKKDGNGNVTDANIETIDGKQYRLVTWTVTYNENPVFSVAGKTITDTIDQNSRSIMSYYGAVTYIKKDADGKQVGGTETAVKNASGSSWEFMISKNDTKPYTYVFTYQTKVALDGLNAETPVKNTITDGRKDPQNSSVNVTPRPGEAAEIDKEVTAVSTSEISWKVTITVPASGISNAKVVDILPKNEEWIGEDPNKRQLHAIDGYVENSLAITEKNGSAYDGQYTVDSKSESDKFTISFTNGISGTGEERKLILTYKTIVNVDWLSNSATQHTNKVVLYKGETYLDESDAIARPTTASITKKLDKTLSATIDGVQYPVYKYQLVIKGLTSTTFTIDDAFDTTYLKFYEDAPDKGNGAFSLDQWGGVEDWKAVQGTVTATATKAGATLTVTLEDGFDLSKTSQIGISYYLIVKDKSALDALNKASATNPVTFSNTATYNGMSSSTNAASYQYKPISKTTTNRLDEDSNLTFTIKVNESGAQLNDGNNLTITDEFKNLAVNPTSVRTDPANALVSYNFSDTKGTIVVKDGMAVTITYTAKPIGTGKVSYENTATLFGQSSSSNEKITVDAESYGSASTHAITILKYDQDTGMSDTLEGAEFSLYHKAKSTDDWECLAKKLTTGADGTCKITGTMSAGNTGWALHPSEYYYVVETKAPAGYQLDETPHYFQISTNNTQDLEQGIYLDGATIAIGNTKQEQAGSLKFTKTFSGLTEEDLKDITFTVTDKDGKQVGDTYKLADLKTTKDDGTVVYEKTISVAPGEYTVTESNANVTGYSVTTKYSVEGGKVTVEDKKTATVDITNEYTYNDHKVKVSKTDINGEEIEGAELKITGKTKDGKEIDPITWTSKAGKTNEVELKPGTYTLHEDKAPGSNVYVLASDIEFTVDINGKVQVAGKDVDKVTMVDEYSDHTVNISKKNVGGEELPGAHLTVRDVDDGTVVADWISSKETHKVTVQPGTYVLHEDTAPVGYNVTNDITFTVDINGKVTVNGKEVTTVTMVDEMTENSISISKVDITGGAELEGARLEIKNASGNVVDSWTSTKTAHKVTLTMGTYTLTETTAPDGYDVAESITFTVDANGKVNNSDTVTMKDASKRTSITVNKNWEDDSNRDRVRPTSIKVKVYGTVNGERYYDSGEYTLNAGNGWKVTISDLPAYYNGTAVVYTADEIGIPSGYERSVSSTTGNWRDGYSVTITNRHTPQTVQVAGSKTWNDNNNAAGTRPNSITIRLYRNGTEIDRKTVTSSNWSWNWTGLTRYDSNGRAYSYTISEDAVSGYTSSVNGYNVTNTLNAYGSVTLAKVDETTGTGLAGAVFDLFRQGGAKVGTYTTNASGVIRVDNLTYGNYYFVETSAPSGYVLDSRQVSFTINSSTTSAAPASVRVTNRRVDENIQVNAVKVWNDKDNKDGVRPSSVTFHLFADGVEIGSGVANAGNNWTVSFGSLPKTRNGVNISYAVTEDEVGNYYTASYDTRLNNDGSYLFTVTNSRETDEDYEIRTGSVRGANRNKPSSGSDGDVQGIGRVVAGAGRGRGTGDDSRMFFGGLSGAAFLSLIGWAIAKKKKKEEE